MQFYKSIVIGFSSFSWGVLSSFNAPLLAQANSVTVEDLILFGDVTLGILGKGQTALDYYNKAIEKDPSHAEAYLKRCSLYGNTVYYNTNNQLNSTQILQQAINDCEQAISLNPNYDLAYIERAYLYIKADDTNAATSSANAALQINPNNKEAQQIIANIEIGKAQERAYERFIQQLSATGQPSTPSASYSNYGSDEFSVPEYSAPVNEPPHANVCREMTGDWHC